MNYNNENILVFENKGRDIIIHWLKGNSENAVYCGERKGKNGEYYLFNSKDKKYFGIRKSMINNMLIELCE